MDEGQKLDVAVAHRHFAISCFNECWNYLEKAARTPEENRVMVSLAMASRWHWSQVPTGKPVNFARSEWQVSRALVLAGQAAAGLEHALSGLACCEANGIGDFDLAFAQESVARAYAALGRRAERDRHAELARVAGEAIREAEDREAFFETGYRSIP